MVFHRKLYIALFMFLGLLVSFLIHASVEIAYIKLLLKDFSRYGLGLSWRDFLFIHDVSSIAVSIAGIMVGYQQGRFWWLYVYKHQGRHH